MITDTDPTDPQDDPRTDEERDLDEWQAEWTETYRALLADTR